MAESGRRVPGWALPVALVVVGAVALAAAGRGGGSDRPLDPRSHERLGTSAFVALVGEMGAEAAITDRLPGPDIDVFVVLDDRLDGSQQDTLLDWVAGGGTLVVTDPGSPLAPVVSAVFGEAEILGDLWSGEPACDVVPLAGIDTAGIEPLNGGVVYDVPFDAASCIGSESEAYVTVEARGAGTVVAFGGTGLFVNAGLAEGENAAVVAAVVTPRPGIRVGVLEPGPLAGGGERGLGDLVSPGVRRFLAQLVIAFVVFAAWRSRRLGNPVAEPQPVAVAGSELVAAVGSLLDRAGSPDHAAKLLRADLRRFLGDRLGVPPEAPPATLAAVAAERVGADEARVAWALGPTPVEDDEQLVVLAQTIDAIREEVLSHV